MRSQHDFRLTTREMLKSDIDQGTRVTIKIVQVMAVIAALSLVVVPVVILFRKSPEELVLAQLGLDPNTVLPTTLPGYDLFGGWKDINGTATGRYHIETIDGRQTFVTPLGHPFYMRAVNDVRWDELSEEKRKELFGNSEKTWAEKTIPIVYSWKFNTLGTNFQDAVLGDGVMRMPYFDVFDKAVDWRNDAPDPWDSEWIASVDARARAYAEQSKSDPFQVAVATATEPPITLLTPDGGQIHPRSNWWRDLLAEPAGSPAKTSFEEVMKKRYNTVEDFNATYKTSFKEFRELRNVDTNLFKPFETIEVGEEPARAEMYQDMVAWNASIVGQYQKVVYLALKKYDPNLLVAGPELAGDGPYDPTILQAISQYADFMVVQDYDSDGFDANYILYIAETAKLPVLHSAFTFAEEPCNVNNLGDTLPSVTTQEERAEKYFDTVNEAIQYPQVLGNNWRSWVDQTVTEATTSCGYLNSGIYDRTPKRYEGMYDRGAELWQRFEEIIWKRPINDTFESPYQPPAPGFGSFPLELPEPRHFYGSEVDAPKEPRADQTYPSLQSILFYEPLKKTQCTNALAGYDMLRFGDVFSSGDDGGQDLGAHRGVANWSDTKYDFRDLNNLLQDQVLAVKQLKPETKVFTHLSMRHLDAHWFDNSTSHPRRKFADDTSPRQFAYTSLIRLQKSTDQDDDVFEFTADDIRRLQDLGVKGTDEMADGINRWVPKIQYEPYYFQFFDNDAGGGHGTQEIMAIKRMWIEGDTGFIQTLPRKRDAGVGTVDSRAIFGKPNVNTYSAGARAGLLSSTDSVFGTLVFLMNPWCLDPANAGGFCSEVNAGGSFLDQTVEYVGSLVMESRVGDTYLVDGVTYDADDEDALKTYSYRFTGYKDRYALDLNGDGQIEERSMIDERMPFIYQEVSQRIADEALRRRLGKFFVVMNGRLAETVNGEPWEHKDLWGREFEDLNGGFNEPNLLLAISQYNNIYNGLVDTQTPVATISSRDREASKQGLVNYQEHRMALSATLVFGDGAYGQTGAYVTNIPECMTNSKEPSSWLDEYSVDPSGVASTHSSYDASASKTAYTHWLGKALGPAEKIAGLETVYQRKFEHGIAIFSGKGGTVQLDQAYDRICGLDPVNDCGKGVRSVTLKGEDGIVLVDPSTR